MLYSVEELLSDQYQMFFHPAVPVGSLSPVQSLSSCVAMANHLVNSFGRNFSTWDSRHHDSIGRIMYVNWIHQRLAVEPIKKPLLIHFEHGKFRVDCGDTRLMALKPLGNAVTVSCVATVRKEHRCVYQDWTQIQTTQDLIAVTGFDSGTANVMFNPAEPNLDWCTDWMEIGDQSTAHHLHSLSDRIVMLQHWLDTQSPEFRFTEEWITRPIDWVSYLH